MTTKISPYSVEAACYMTTIHGHRIYENPVYGDESTLLIDIGNGELHYTPFWDTDDEGEWVDWMRDEEITNAFAVLRTDITRMVALSPDVPEGTLVYELLLFIVGEATHVCSLTPSTCILPYAYDVEPPEGVDNDDERIERLEDDLRGQIEDRFSYTAMIGPEQMMSDSVSDIRSCVTWDDAIEEFQSSAPDFYTTK